MVEPFIMEKQGILNKGWDKNQHSFQNQLESMLYSVVSFAFVIFQILRISLRQMCKNNELQSKIQLTVFYYT